MLFSTGSGVFTGVCQLPIDVFDTDVVFKCAEGEFLSNVTWSNNAKYLVLTTTTKQVQWTSELGDVV